MCPFSHSYFTSLHHVQTSVNQREEVIPWEISRNMWVSSFSIITLNVYISWTKTTKTEPVAVSVLCFPSLYTLLYKLRAIGRTDGTLSEIWKLEHPILLER